MPNFTNQTTLWIDETLGVGTHYRAIPGLSYTAISLASAGTGAATVYVQHTDYPVDFNGAAVAADNTDDRLWRTDDNIAVKTIAASTTTTGGIRVAFASAPRRLSRAKIVVSVAGRFIGAYSGIA